MEIDPRTSRDQVYIARGLVGSQHLVDITKTQLSINTSAPFLGEWYKVHDSVAFRERYSCIFGISEGLPLPNPTKAGGE